MAEFSSRKGWVALAFGSLVLASSSVATAQAQAQAPHAAFSAATPAAPPPPPSPPPPTAPPPVTPATPNAPAAEPGTAPSAAPVAPGEPASPSTPPAPPAPPPPAPTEPPPPTMAVAYTMPASLPACTTSAVPSPCAQPPEAYRHEGFYLRLAGGLNYSAFSGTGNGRDVSIHGFTQRGALAIGGTIADGLVLAGVLGGEQVRDKFHGGPSPERKATAALGELGVLVDYYPKPTDGWHFGAVAALGAITLSDSGLRDATGASFAGTLFGGYDFWIGPEWSLGLMLTFSGATTANLKDSDGDDIGYKLHALSAGLSYVFTLH